MALPTYSTGTVSVDVAGAVTVSGGIWSGSNVVEGDRISVDGGADLLISGATDATHGQIVGWSGGAVSDKTYIVYKTSSRRFDDVQIADDLKDQVQALNTEGYFVFVASTDAAPDPSLGDDGMYALQPSTGKLWYKEGGVWNASSNFRGIKPDYTVNEITSTSSPAEDDRDAHDADPENTIVLVASEGKIYVKLSATSGDWSDGVSVKGDTGEQGPAGPAGADGADGADGATGPAPLKPIEAWATATAYVAGPPASFVSQSGSSYECLVDHTSGTFSTDLAAGKWGLVASKGADGSGVGDMTKAVYDPTNVEGDAFDLDNMSPAPTTVGKALFTATDGAAARAAISAPLAGYINGLTLSNDAVTPNTVLDIAAGVAASDDGTTLMTLASAITKTTGSWAVGSGNGGLDTGTVAANTWYHAFQIERTDTRVVDVLFSTSPTSPTMPTNYTKKRYIGPFLTNSSGNIVAFSQSGKEFLWKVPASDLNAFANPGTSAVLQALTVPAGIQSTAIFSFALFDATPSGGTFVLVTSPDQVDTAPSTTAFSLLVPGQASGDGMNATLALRIRTNTSRQIRYRLDNSTTDHRVYIVTMGFVVDL